jgi:hypothetical protein
VIRGTEARTTSAPNIAAAAANPKPAVATSTPGKSGCAASIGMTKPQTPTNHGNISRRHKTGTTRTSAHARYQACITGLHNAAAASA